LFINRNQTAIFFLNQFNKAILVFGYVGPDELYAESLRDLQANAQQHELQINMFAMEESSERMATLKAQGFSINPVGVWSYLDDLPQFSLQGKQKQRLRYMVSRYEKLGTCEVCEYQPGTVPATDSGINEIIDAWHALKEKTIPFVEALKRDIINGEMNRRHRLFITKRDGNIEAVIILSSAGSKPGYLMDLEFYRKDTELGCLEYSIVNIIELLKAEGSTYYSLGLTMGTQLVDHPDESAEIKNLFVKLHDEGLLNGDGNFQFKNKFRPIHIPVYLCRQAGSGLRFFNDVVLMIGNYSAAGK
jgi:lysylphosphatidylglycerol synthetase-like protein (DUF2156 family)